MLLIKNGRVVDPASKTDATLDVLLDGEKIKEVGPAGKIAMPSEAEIFDASGLIVAPGFIDIHVHLREPGQESSETIETGTRAAARGGFTAVCCMPNTKPVNDNASVTRFILDRAKAAGSVRVWPIGAASVGSKGEAIAEIAAMKEAGIVGVSDDGKPIATAKLARQVMDYCRSLDLPVIEHAEDVSLAAGAVMREGVTSTRLGVRGMAAAAGSVGVGVAAGTVEALATDHPPHEPALKDVEFDRAPFGILGFETALALALEQLVQSGRISLMRMVELFTTGPARGPGMERKIAAGQPADLTIFSTERAWTYNVKDSPSKSRNSPFDGRNFKGGPMATIVAGRVVYKR